MEPSCISEVPRVTANSTEKSSSLPRENEDHLPKVVEPEQADNYPVEDSSLISERDRSLPSFLEEFSAEYGSSPNAKR